MDTYGEGACSTRGSQEKGTKRERKWKMQLQQVLTTPAASDLTGIISGGQLSKWAPRVRFVGRARVYLN